MKTRTASFRSKHEATWLAEGWYGPGTDWESADCLNETLQSDLKHLSKWENELSDWQDGVEKYEEWGCGDVADLNGDFGQEWLALYTVKSPKKGAPILADSLTLQYGSRKIPGGCTKGLHLFAYSNAADLGDTAW